MVWTVIAYLLAGVVFAFAFKGIKAYSKEIKEARKKKVAKNESKDKN